MASLRHSGALRKATRIREETEELKRSMRHDPLTQAFATAALPNLLHLERRAATVVAAEEAVDASATTRSNQELRLRAANGDGSAMAEMCRRNAFPRAA